MKTKVYTFTYDYSNELINALNDLGITYIVNEDGGYINVFHKEVIEDDN